VDVDEQADIHIGVTMITTWVYRRVAAADTIICLE